MSIANKYEMLSKPDNASGQDPVVPIHGLHLRLDREAQLYRIPKGSVDPRRAKALVSAMARLDHSLIPHVIDLLDEADAYHLVTEFVSGTKSSRSEDAWERLSDLEQVASALCHASTVGLAHGALQENCLRVDRNSQNSQRSMQGQLKLVGVGLRQFAPHDLAKLLTADLRQLKQLVAKAMGDALALEEDLSSDSVESKVFQKFQSRLAKSEDSICSFSEDYRVWLHKELAIREAKKLAVSDRDTESTHEKRTNRIPIVTAIVASVLLLSGALGYAFWPSSSSSVSSVAKTTSEVSDTESDDQPSPVDKPVTSSLQNVGTLNTTDEPPKSEVNASNGDAAEGDNSPAEVVMDPDPVVPENTPEMEATEIAPKKSALPETPDEQPEPEPEPKQPKRKKSPFEGSVASIDLPQPTSSAALQLLTTDLRDDEPLQIEMLTAISKKQQFAIRESSANRWEVVQKRKSDSTVVAEFARRDAELFFRWLPETSSLPFANQMRNSILVLRSGKWSGDLALRTPIKKPAVLFDLERKRPHDLELDHPPAEMFLEFAPTKGELAAASPESIPWDDDAVMTVGLDAGKKSLVMLQLKPIPKTKLRTICLVRQSKVADRKPINRGFGRALKSQVAQLNQNLFRMKQGVKTIKGKDAKERKKQVERVIKQLEEQKKVTDRFQEAYGAAVATRIGLRVYAQLDDRKLVLAEFTGL